MEKLRNDYIKNLKARVDMMEKYEPMNSEYVGKDVNKEYSKLDQEGRELSKLMNMDHNIKNIFYIIDFMYSVRWCDTFEDIDYIDPETEMLRDYEITVSDLEYALKNIEKLVEKDHLDHYKEYINDFIKIVKNFESDQND